MLLWDDIGVVEAIRDWQESFPLFRSPLGIERRMCRPIKLLLVLNAELCLWIEISGHLLLFLVSFCVMLIPKATTEDVFVVAGNVVWFCYFSSCCVPL